MLCPDIGIGTSPTNAFPHTRMRVQHFDGRDRILIGDGMGIRCQVRQVSDWKSREVPGAVAAFVALPCCACVGMAAAIPDSPARSRPHL